MITNPNSTTVSIKDINGNVIEINNFIQQLANYTPIPSFVQFCSNPVVEAVSEWKDWYFTQQIKTKQTVTYKDGAFIKDPKTVVPENISVQTARISPSQIVDKIGINDIDLTTELGQKLFIRAIGNWASQKRPLFEISILNDLTYWANKCQEELIKTDSNASIIEKGAHFDNSFDNAKNKLDYATVKTKITSAIDILTTIGLPTSKTNYDAGNKFEIGDQESNIMTIVNRDVIEAIGDKVESVNPAAYEEIFKKAGLKEFQNVTIQRLSTLPKDVYFIMFLTGEKSPFVHQDCAGGLQVIVQDDPDWPFNKVANIKYNFQHGVFQPNHIIVFANKSFTVSENLPELPNYAMNTISNLCRIGQTGSIITSNSFATDAINKDQTVGSRINKGEKQEEEEEKEKHKKNKK